MAVAERYFHSSKKIHILKLRLPVSVKMPKILQKRSAAAYFLFV
jgi:hypothetical protein